MNVQFITRPYSKKLGKGEGGYRGRIIGRTSRSFKEIAEAASSHLGTSAHQVEAVFSEVMDEIIRDACQSARIQNLSDYGSLTLNLHGKFDGIDDRFDPSRHSLEFKFTNGKALKNVRPGFELENITKGAKIELLGMAADPDLFGPPVERRFMAWGLDTYCQGSEIQLCEGAAATWACKLADGSTHAGPVEVFNNDKFLLDFRWPSGIPEAAIGRELTLTFRFRGSQADSVPITRQYKVKLYPRSLARK